MDRQILPHLNVYTRLKPSKIHGVGVFAIQPIPKGMHLLNSDEEIYWIDEAYIRQLPKNLRRLYEDFCIIKNGKYGCPQNFNNLTMGWYLNDSSNPNVAMDEDYNLYAIRDIAEGEELTIDSSKFSEQPYRKMATQASE
jgi:uncharacterized protein